MEQGFNSHIGYMTGSQWCPSGALEGWKYDQVVDELKGTNSVLRFPGGTISRTYGYQSADIHYFNKLCRDTGSKVTFVVNMNDIQNSINTSKLIESEIVLYEAGNEEYDYTRAPIGWEWLMVLFNIKGWYRRLGQEYGRKYLQVKNGLSGAPVAACINIPNDNKNTAWLQGVQDVVDLKDIVVHRYYNPGDVDFFDSLDKHLHKLDRYNIYYTELNCKWRPGEYQEVAYTDNHKQLLSSYISYLKDRPNTMMILVHSLWGHYLFSRYIVDGNQVIDMYKDWY